MKRYDYFWARASIQITGIVFVSQLITELSGIAVREPGFEWVIYACGVAFFAAILYSFILILLNTRNRK